MMNRKQTPQLHDKELELISAYLDGQLPEAQRKLVRQRLAQDETFKQVFEDLRMTRLALRSAPQIKRRRSFTLTPDMVGARDRGFTLQSASRLVAMVATVLLVAVFAGDMLFIRSSSQMSFAEDSIAGYSAMNESAEMEMLSAEEAAGGGGVAPEELEAAVEEEAAAEADMAEEAAPVAEEEVEEESVVEEETVEEAAVEEAEGEDTAESTGTTDDDQGFAPPSTMPTATKVPEGTMPPEPERVIPTEETNADEWADTVEEPADGEIMRMQVPEEEVGTQPTEKTTPEIPWFSIIELSLLAIAIGSGAAGLLFRRER